MLIQIDSVVITYDSFMGCVEFFLRTENEKIIAGEITGTACVYSLNYDGTWKAANRWFPGSFFYWDRVKMALLNSGIRMLIRQKDFAFLQLYKGDRRIKYVSDVIDRVVDMANCHTVLMCTEINPMECHRGIILGRVLKERGVLVSHIIERGKVTIMSQEEIEEKILDEHYPNRDQLCFLEEEVLTRAEMLRRAYKKETQKIGRKKS